MEKKKSAKATATPAKEAELEVVPEDDTSEETSVSVIPDTAMPSAYNLPNMGQIKEYENFLKNYDAFVDRMLKDGTDYGLIPGVEKPSLLKPGAEKLEKLFFLRHKKECVLKEVADDGSFIRYTYRTSIFNKQGQLVATCEGTCNSKEKKYRSSWVFENQATPEQKADGRLETRTSKGGKPYNVYVIEKEDFYDLENTIMKMAQKRSYVGAILEATNSSSRFTQDVEDMDLGGGKGGAADKTPPPPQASTRRTVSAPVKQPERTIDYGDSQEAPSGEQVNCQVCAVPLDDRVANYSIKMYKKPLCREHQRSS